MKCAVITGASSGMGKEFIKKIDKYYQLDRIYAIARRKNKLEELNQYTKAEIIPLDLDLTKKESFLIYEEKLKEDNPNIKILINCAGFGKFEEFTSSELSINSNMVELNCNALQMMTHLTIPYMKEDSRIVNLASMSSIQPVPYINLYGATKAFVLSFSRALNVELKKQKIHVIAITPYWVKTEFFDIANPQKIVNNFDIVYTPEFIITKSFKEIIKKKPKDVICPGKYAKLQYFLVKILPHKFVMKIWLNKQNLNKK